MKNDECLTEREILIRQNGSVRVYYGDHREPYDDEFDEVISILDDMNNVWVSMVRTEAITAARAILNHFNVGLDD